jgi:NAD(P)-dependent dehydrogenase (short-subunit alcohol dehydrogenase family)
MPVTIDFSGKLVLLTGGGRGIGLAIATALVKGEHVRYLGLCPNGLTLSPAGADVAITYTSKDATPVAEDLTKQYGTRVKAYKCEVSQSSDVDRTVEAVQKDYGKQIDIGVANAGKTVTFATRPSLTCFLEGIALWKEAESNTDEDFKRIFDVNTFGPFYLARALTRSWMSLPISADNSVSSTDPPTNLGKQIFFVSSVSGNVAMTPQKQTAYNASKAALTMLAKVPSAHWCSLRLSYTLHRVSQPNGRHTGSLSTAFLLYVDLVCR